MLSSFAIACLCSKFGKGSLSKDLTSTASCSFVILHLFGLTSELWTEGWFGSIFCSCGWAKGSLIFCWLFGCAKEGKGRVSVEEEEHEWEGEEGEGAAAEVIQGLGAGEMEEVRRFFLFPKLESMRLVVGLECWGTPGPEFSNRGVRVESSEILGR